MLLSLFIPSVVIASEMPPPPALIAKGVHTVCLRTWRGQPAFGEVAITRIGEAEPTLETTDLDRQGCVRVSVEPGAWRVSVGERGTTLRVGETWATGPATRYLVFGAEEVVRYKGLFIATGVPMASRGMGGF